MILPVFKRWILRLSFLSGEHPGRDQAWETVRENPFRPIVTFERKPSTELDNVDTETLARILVDDGRLLDEVLDPDGFLLQAQVIPELVIGDGRD